MATTHKHIRVKHKDETIFIMIEPQDTFGKIRAKLSSITTKPTSAIRLIGDDKTTTYEDQALLSDMNIKDDQIIYMVYLTDDGVWEEIDVPKYELEHEAKK